MPWIEYSENPALRQKNENFEQKGIKQKLKKMEKRRDFSEIK